MNDEVHWPKDKINYAINIFKAKITQKYCDKLSQFWVVENASQKYFELGFSDTPQVINNATENNIGKDFGKDFNINEMQKKILAIMRQNPEITTDRIAESIGITRRHIEANIRQLKALGALERIGGRKNGNWAVKI